MPRAVLSHIFGAELCTALGIDPNTTKGIIIAVRADGVPVPRGRIMTRLVPAAILALALAGCVLPPPLDEVHNEPPVTCLDDGSCAEVGTAVSVVALDTCVDPDGYPFFYVGPMESAPWDACGSKPLLQTTPTKGAK